MSRNLTFVSRALTEDWVQKPEKCEISYIYRRYCSLVVLHNITVLTRAT